MQFIPKDAIILHIDCSGLFTTDSKNIHLKKFICLILNIILAV